MALMLGSLLATSSSSHITSFGLDASHSGIHSFLPSRGDSITNVSSNQINTNRFYSSEPAPMGITDFGIGPNGPYSYNTSSFLGILHLNSLKTLNSTGDPKLSMQLNIVLKFTSNSGGQYVYWVQDAAIFNSQDNAIYFLDNVWNMTSSPPSMQASGISGKGKIYQLDSSQSYYAAVASTSLPGNGVNLRLPAPVELEGNSTINQQNETQVNIAYNDGRGWVTFDTVVFTGVEDVQTDYGFVVNGKTYNPLGTYYDAELIFGGAGNGWNTTNIQSNVFMQLEYWNGHNYQGIYNAYNFGSDTREGIDNVTSIGSYFKTNGSLGAQISSGSGNLGLLYDRSQISIISVRSPFTSGTFDMRNASSSGTATSYPFVGGDVNVSVAPGTYVLSIYNSQGILVAQETRTVSAGQYLQIHVTSSSFVTFTMSYDSLGGSPEKAPTLTYFLNGQEITEQLSTTPSIYYLDPGSQWSVTRTISGQAQNERWDTNHATKGTANSDQTINFLFYHQFGISFNFTVVGGGLGYSPPLVRYIQFGVPELISNGSKVWVDAGTSFSYPETLSGSSQFERWQYIGGQTLNGTVSQNPVTIFYSHQYYVTIQSPLPNSGTESPSSGWYDASSNIVLTETNSSGWGFGGWIGTGPGSYTGNDTTKSIRVIGPITERAVFLPSITVKSSRGGSVELSYDSISRTVQEGRSTTVYLKPDTVVTLTAKASSLINSFEKWNGTISGDELSLNISSPTTLTAAFQYNYLNISLIAGVPIIALAAALILVNMRRGRAQTFPGV